MRVKRALTATAATFIALVIVATGAYVYVTQYREEVKTESLGPNGGTVEQSGVTVKVPQGLLTKPTKLIITKPTALPADKARFNAPTLRFDISFADGSQPTTDKPLDVQIPLQGAFLPAGAKPENALMYSPNAAGEWRLVPSVVEGGVLHAKLSHLSPKEISFASPGEFWDSINPWKPREVKNCNREITVKATGKVKLGGSGWKTDTSSVLHPCLVEENGKTMLRVGNNTGLMWSVASSGANINAPDGSTEAGMIKLIVSTLTPNKKVKAYLAEGDATWTNVTKDDLPVTLEFRADPNTFLAQAFWVGLNMAVGMFVGKDSGQTANHIKTLLTAVDSLDCLNKAAETANGSTDAKKVVDILLSTCTEMIATVLGVDVKSRGAAEWVLGGIMAALDGIKDSLGLLGTAFQGIIQQVNGNVTIKVTQAAPPCATTWSFKEALGSGKVTRATNIKCSNGWAYGSIGSTGSGSEGQWLIRFVDGKWTRVHTLFEPLFYGTESGDRICGELPADFRKELCMHI